MENLDSVPAPAGEAPNVKAQDALDQLATFARHDRDCAYSPAEYDHVGTQQVRERPCDCGMHEALSILRAALGAIPRIAELEAALADFTEFFMGEDLEGPQYDSWVRARTALGEGRPE